MNKTIIIAEAGVNHNGSVELAKKLILEAKRSGADFVKFQTFKSELIIAKNAKKANYQSKNTGNSSESQLDMIKKLELSFDDFKLLHTYCNEVNIGFLSTAFDIPSIDFLLELNLPFFKCPSGEITNYPYLKKLAETGKPVILSTGMATINEIKNALIVFSENGLQKENVTVLHCNTEYPTPMEDVNLKAMNTIEKELKVKVGYSDHTLGIEVPVAAVARGALVIEKHFTLDRNLPGPDHKASLEPDELKAMVLAIRNIEKAISGHGKKIPAKSELKNLEVARKSIYVNKDLKKGHILTEDDLIALRPGNGISPMEWNQIIGKKLLTDISKLNQLKPEQFQ